MTKDIITFLSGDKSITLEYLSRAVDSDCTSVSADIKSLIDAINEVITLPINSTDIDRDGFVALANILRELDLLNGAVEFESWFNVSLSYILQNNSI